MLKSTRTTAGLVAALALAGLSGGLAAASSTGATVTLCVAKANGVVRQAHTCKKNERTLIVNQSGQRGATGPMGPQGVRGLQGLAGATGPVGPQGNAGASGTPGLVAAFTGHGQVNLPLDGSTYEQILAPITVPPGNFVVQMSGAAVNSTSSAHAVSIECNITAGTATATQTPGEVVENGVGYDLSLALNQVVTLAALGTVAAPSGGGLSVDCNELGDSAGVYTNVTLVATQVSSITG